MNLRLKRAVVATLGSMFLVVPGEAVGRENSQGVLEDVVVLGQKVERSQRETSASFDVRDAKDIDRHADNHFFRSILGDSANVLDTGWGNDLPVIRGLEGAVSGGAMAFFTGARPRISMRVDGRALNYTEMGFALNSLWDLERAEVFKGPQSYIQGRNSIAGSIVMRTKDPAPQFGASVQLGYGNQSLRQFSAMLTGPVVEDELLFRLAASKERFKSAEDLIDYEPVGDSSLFDNGSVRAKLAWYPKHLPNFNTKLTFSHVDSRAPQGVFRSVTENDRRRSVFETLDNSLIWDLNWEINERLRFSNSLEYTRFKHDRLALPQFSPAKLKGGQVSLEPVLKWKSPKFDGLLGFYFHGAREDDEVLMMGEQTYKDKVDTQAAFGEIHYRPREKLSLELALRVEREKHTRKGGAKNLIKLDHEQTDTVALPKFGVAYSFSPKNALGFNVSRGYNAGGAGIAFKPPFTPYKYDSEFVWNYELYHRFRNESGSFQLRSNLFYNDYRNMQIPYSDTAGLSMIGNAEQVSTYGAEFGLDWLPFERLTLQSGLGLLKTDVKQFDAGPEVKGKALRRTPPVTFSLAGHYQFPKGFEAGADVRYVGAYHTDYVNSPEAKIDAYATANAYVAYKFGKGRVKGDLRLFANNILGSDKKILYIPGGWTTYQRARHVGASLRLDY